MYSQWQHIVYSLQGNSWIARVASESQQHAEKPRFPTVHEENRREIQEQYKKQFCTHQFL